MSAVQKRRSPRRAGSAQSEDNDAASIPLGRPEFQEKAGNARNRNQRPPQWTPPKGWHAGDLLERLWGPPRKRRGRA
jgi:hypothetical protein